MTTAPSRVGVVMHWLFGRGEHRWRVADELQISAALGRIPLDAGSGLRRRVEAAGRRRDEGGARFLALFIYSPLGFVVWLPLIGMITFGSTRLISVFTALIFTTCTVGLWRTLLYRVLLARMMVPLVALISAYTWWVVYSMDSGMAGLSPPVARFSILVLIFGSLPGTFWFYRKWRRSVRVEAHAYDVLAIAVLHVADRIYEERNLWRRGAKVRQWCGSLENLAVEAARYLALRERIDPADAGLRSELRDEALRVGESIRLHKRALVTAVSAEDVERVVASLVNGIDALVREDRAALLANAPGLPSRASRLRAAGARVLPGVVLIGIAWALPLIPGISHTAESSARLMLLVLGVTSILSSPDAAGHVRDVLGKALPFK
ncbi:hypothetical protein [Streptomyces sp. NPDC092952]|uniref:hypothetical protein n=1 Tax=Streptomyces sp. NPDC092952 TaxID=3366018 RepID=UPI0038265C18